MAPKQAMPMAFLFIAKKAKRRIGKGRKKILWNKSWSNLLWFVTAVVAASMNFPFLRLFSILATRWFLFL